MARRSDEFVAAHAHARLTTGEVIRMLRELKSWTQQELAKRSGINTSNISLLENGRVENRQEARRAACQSIRRSSCSLNMSRNTSAPLLKQATTVSNPDAHNRPFRGLDSKLTGVEEAHVVRGMLA
jgi:transcriptional regulator with XRE-family HTH domain